MSTSDDLTAVNQREVTKPRLIAALLSELDVSMATVFATDLDSGAVVSSQVLCQFNIPFDQSFLELQGVAATSQRLQCVCCHAGQRMTFEISRQDSGHWSIPKRMLLVDLRRASRLEFAKRQYSVEIVTARGAIYGFAVDISQECLAVDIDSKSEMQLQGLVKAIVRLVGTNFDVFYSDCQVMDFSRINPSKYRLLLNLKKPQESLTPGTRRAFERVKVSGVSLELRRRSHTESDITVISSLENLGQGGMTVRIRAEHQLMQPIPGSILTSKEVGVPLMIVWTQGDEMGLRPLLSDAEALNRWYRYVDRISPESKKRSNVSRKELSDLFTHSGLIKGSRREPFGQGVDKHLIVNSEFESGLLTQRYVIAKEGGSVDIHVSSKRISENAWFLGEGAGLTDSLGLYRVVLEGSTQRAVWLSNQSSFFCRYLTFIWHESVKPTAEWSKVFIHRPSSRIMDAVQCSIKSIEQHSPPNLQPGLISSLTAAKRRTIALQFNADLFEAMVGLDGTHPIMNSELQKLGPYHKVQTKFVTTVEETTLIAHRIITHNVWSTTGVTNSVFVLVPKGASTTSIVQVLASFAKDDISFGTDDFLIIFDGQEGESKAFREAHPKAKLFHFLIHDLLQNDTDRYKDRLIADPQN